MKVYWAKFIYINLFIITSLFLSAFLSYFDLFLPTYCKCKWLLLKFITLNDTHTNTLSRTSLYERSACRRDLYLTTNNVQKADSHLSKQGATDPRLRPRDYRDRLCRFCEVNDSLKTSVVVDAHSQSYKSHCLLSEVYFA